jgi:SAM-dependent methyltransferase
MRTEDEMVAYALESSPELLPFIPELLADLEELGSEAELIVQVLRELELPKTTSVVDLGCGKGAVAVEVLEELDFEVLGIELFRPFITSCTELARTRGVSDRCRFLQGDIRKMAGRVPPADVAIFAALGDVLGRLDDTIGIIRQYVKPGGCLMIADPFLADSGSPDFPGFEQYAGYQETAARLTSCGDVIVRSATKAGRGK